MSYVKTNWSDRSVEFPNRYKDQDNVVYNFTRDEGTVSNEGTLVNAVAMNNIENGLEQVSNGWLNAGGTFTYASADAPTFVMNTSVDTTGYISVGMKIKLNQTVDRYFIVTAITSSTVTMYGGTDYVLSNAAISNVQYSMWKNPYGFPMNPDKWSVSTRTTAGFTQLNPTQNVWYNANSLIVPIGNWEIHYSTPIYALSNGAKTSIRVSSTLSTANNTEDDLFMTVIVGFNTASASLTNIGLGTQKKNIDISTKTTYYLNIRTTSISADISQIGIGNASGTEIKAVCAYL